MNQLFLYLYIIIKNCVQNEISSKPINKQKKNIKIQHETNFSLTVEESYMSKDTKTLEEITEKNFESTRSKS